MASNYNVDFPFIEGYEKFRTTGYVNKCTQKSITNANKHCIGLEVGDPMPGNGVTIGAGVDLGALNEDDLKKLKLPDALYKKLKPYLGDDGIEENNNNTLVLGADEARLLSNRRKDRIFSIIAQKYKDDSNKEFSSLSNDLQTAICDFFYQHGENSMSNKYERELWNFITKGDWENVVTFLRNAKQDPERRKDEADLVIKSEEYKPVLQKTKLNLDDVNRSRS